MNPEKRLLIYIQLKTYYGRIGRLNNESHY